MVRLLFIALLVAWAMLVEGCANDQSSSASPGSIEAFRQEKDAAFGDPRTSPLSTTDLAGFSGLHYFGVDSSYRVMARLEPLPTADTFQMSTTHADDHRMALRAGRLVFSVKSTPCTLMVYRFVGQDIPGFFVPFTDATSGMESYGAGRYLDLQEQSQDVRDYIVDFNTAYNPYCAYNDAYSCPLVPEENHLPVAILAGEKSWP
jgi:uncharacterized protein (DUF1684 family)